MSIDREIDQVECYNFCYFCDVPVMRNNGFTHCHGRRHRSLVCDIIEAGWCSECSVKISRSWTNVEQHINGRAHRMELNRQRHQREQQQQQQRQQQQQDSDSSDSDDSGDAHRPFHRIGYLAHVPATSTTSSRPPLDSRVADIVRSGRCRVCSCQVSPNPDVAQQHLDGLKHTTRVRLNEDLTKSNWKETLEKLQQPQEGVTIETIVNGNVVVPLQATVQFAAKSNGSNNPDFHFRVANTSNATVRLRRIFGIPSQTVKDLGLFIPSFEGGSLLIRPGQSSRIFGQYEDSHRRPPIGFHHCLLAFDFGRFTMLRAIDVRALDGQSGISLDVLQEMSSSASTAPYKHKTQQSIHHYLTHNNMDIEDGEPPPAIANAAAKYVRKLPFYDLPSHLPPKKTIETELETPLTQSNYANRFHRLLQLEEIQMNADIEVFDRIDSFSIGSGPHAGTLQMDVAGLAENRPSVQKGDKILASKSPFTKDGKGMGKVYAGYVHLVEKERVFIKFSRQFHQNYIRFDKYYLRFTFNRIPIRRCHQGIDLLQQSKSITRLSVVDQSLSFGPSVTVTDDPDDCDEWIFRYIHGGACLRHIGIDTESEIIPYRPNQLRIVQIATFDAVLIYRLNEMSAELQELLKSPTMVKHSIGPEHALGDEFDINLMGFCDAQQVAKDVMKTSQQPSTQAIMDRFLPHLNFRKNKSLQTSDWGQWPLSRDQIEYAAKDALVALAIGYHLMYGHSDQVKKMSLNLRIPSLSQVSNSLRMTFNSRFLNEIQQTAVRSIVSGEYHPAPFILFGPPGTGLNTTINNT